ncbi:MAG: CvpA family protein [Chloroflexi bacterium]|nr:CvpA family protein [Chloroflexota bacterium]
MNWLDIVIIVLLAASVFGGWRNGLIKSVLSLAGLVIGVSLAGRYYVVLAERLTFVPQAQLAQIVAFVIILVAVILITMAVGVLLTSVISSISLGWVNRAGGIAFGLIVGAISVGATLAIWVKFLGVTDTISNSALATFLLGQFPAVLALLPPEFDMIRSFFR